MDIFMQLILGTITTWSLSIFFKKYSNETTEHFNFNKYHFGSLFITSLRSNNYDSVARFNYLVLVHEVNISSW